jgi:hypothetical protein
VLAATSVPGDRKYTTYGAEPAQLDGPTTKAYIIYGLPKKTTQRLSRSVSPSGRLRCGGTGFACLPDGSRLLMTCLSRVRSSRGVELTSLLPPQPTHRRQSLYVYLCAIVQFLASIAMNIYSYMPYRNRECFAPIASALGHSARLCKLQHSFVCAWTTVVRALRKRGFIKDQDRPTLRKAAT